MRGEENWRDAVVSSVVRRDMIFADEDDVLCIKSAWMAFDA